MAMTSKDSGLEALKKFAINSINYSAMNESEKGIAMTKWQEQWNHFIEELLHAGKNL